jgi:type II secretory pathway pseudopilin PulG
MTLRNHRGISTIETLFALTLLGVTASGLAATTVASIRANHRSANAVAASALIQAKIEQLRALDPLADPVDLRAGPHSDPLNPLRSDGQTGGTLELTWTVTRDTPYAGMARVVVSVKDLGTRRDLTKGVTYLCIRRSCV